ncbi:MAG: glycosyltransferase family 2 protein [Dehalococcoidia bacterium]|nr:glycosyltransferase family 2 protein [Dehalococcoidia bacterium]
MSPGIVIVTFRCRDLALACLESLATHLPHALPATVVVDNASGDGTVEAVRERFPAVTVIEERSNLGFAAAANSGIRALPGCDVVCLLNPDAVVLDSGLDAAACYLRDNGDTGVLGARIENMDGTIQPSCRAFPGHLTALFNRHSLATRFLPGNRWSQRYLMTEWNHEDVREVDWVSGACMLIHRRAIDRVGLLDPAYFFSIEDVDYCRRVHDAGLAVRYFPAARIQHRVGGSTKHAAYRAMYAHHRGMWTYYRRHMRGSIPMDAFTAAGIGARLGVHVVSYTLRRLRQRIFAAV